MEGTAHERPVRSPRAGLSQSSKALGDSLGGLLAAELSAEQLDALEDLLIMADLGVEAAGNIVAALRQRKDLKDLTKPNCAPRLRRKLPHCWHRPSTRLTCPPATRRA